MDQPANHIMFRGGQPGAADRMRELLARTVQDHISDQRSHTSALEEIRKHLEGLEWLVKEVRQHELAELSGQLAAETDGLLRQLADARENAPAWAESLPGAHSRALRPGQTGRRASRPVGRSGDGVRESIRCRPDCRPRTT